MVNNAGTDTGSVIDSIASLVRGIGLGNPLETIEEIIKRATNETGDGGDSDAKGTGFKLMNEFALATRDSQDHKLLNDYDEIEMNVDDIEDNHMLSYPSANSASGTPVLRGAPSGWQPPTAPEDWKLNRQRAEDDEPTFEDIDNPGEWDRFMF